MEKGCFLRAFILLGFLYFVHVGGNLCNLSPCKNNTTCVNINETFYQCNCYQGLKGQNCSQKIDKCDDNPCLNNGTCIPGNSSDYSCQCNHGYGGDNCSQLIDNCNDTCTIDETCDNSTSICECLSGFRIEETGLCGYNSTCQDSNVCQNNSTCNNTTGTPECSCLPGYNGTYCENLWDYCQSEPCKNGGICSNRPSENRFECFCAQGFVGLTCESELNACLSDPCYNGTCIQHTSFGGAYVCVCAEGFAGKSCGIDIDDCATNPCRNGAKCIDRIASFTCNCTEGWEGKSCEVNIDECASNPCQNDGVCNDKINGYICECIPGYNGILCENDIDECQSLPCQHNSTCTHGINTYNCNCSDTGYKGLNCEIEINECASNPCSNNATCIDLINQFTCQCHDGYSGTNCEIDINECYLSPCEYNSTCIEKSNQSLYDGIYFPGVFSYSKASGYSCNCTEGYEGLNCEAEINECLSDPCDNNSTCTDLLADYVCECKSSNYSGKNCSVELIGCKNKPCFSGGTNDCIPYLIDEIKDLHTYECKCKSGYAGVNCNYTTSVTFSVESSITVKINVTDLLTFDFKTNQADASLLFVSSNNTTESFKVFLQHGQFHVQYGNQSSVTDFVLDDSRWHTIKIDLTNNGIGVIIKDSDYCSTTCTVLSANSSVGHLNHFKFGREILLNSKNIIPSFHGCMRDILLSDTLLVPAIKKELPFVFKSIVHGCKRKEVCFNQTCGSNGSCVDLWTDYRCDCLSPYIGEMCSMEVTPATFSYEETTSQVEFTLDEIPGQSFSVSFFILTRDLDGLILGIGSVNSTNETVSFGAKLNEGKIQIYIENKSVFLLETLLNDGKRHFVIIDVNFTEVNVTIDNKRESHLENQTINIIHKKVFIGGMKYFPNSSELSRQKRQLIDINKDFYKGILQDVNYNNQKLLFFKQDKNEYNGPLLLPTTAVSIIAGKLSDDVCTSQPCNNSGICISEFNFRTCQCNSLWRGEDCSEPAFCVYASCTNGSICQDVANGYECIPTASFNGNTDFVEFITTDVNYLQNISLWFRTRRVNSSFLQIALEDGIKILINLDKNGRLLISNSSKGYFVVETNHADGMWHNLIIDFERILLDNMLSAFVMDKEFLNSTVKKISISSYLNETQLFKGCLRDVRINGVLLPLLNDSYTGINQTYSLSRKSTELKGGCHGDSVCQPSPCINGFCSDVFNDYECSCNAGFDGRNCSLDINECFSTPCVYGECIDMVNMFSCHCLTGYNGSLCETEIDECESSPCLNNATCEDDIAGYTCKCSENFVGENCQVDISMSCSADNSTCLNRGICRNITTSSRVSFNCTCPIQYEGKTCESEVDFCKGVNCGNGTCIQEKSSGTSRCDCSPGYYGNKCENDINECDEKPCNNSAPCINLIGSFECKCLNGWKDKNCSTDIDECEIEECSGFGKCMNSLGSFECHCLSGYAGRFCEVAGPCTEKPCKHGVCFQNTALMEYNCECDKNWLGVNCSIFDKCSLQPCKHGSSCTQNKKEEVVCNCTSTGYQGVNCTVDVDECQSSPCQNSNGCENTPGSYNCKCIPQNGFLDKHCTIRNYCVQENGSPTCLNNGHCSLEFNEESKTLKHSCNCTEQYAGSQCQHEVPCMTIANLCRNNGKCLTTWPSQQENITDSAPGYVCICRIGYSGEQCQSFVWLIAGTSLGALGFILMFIMVGMLTCYVLKLRKSKGVYRPRETELVDTTASTDMFHFNNIKTPRKTLERLI